VPGSGSSSSFSSVGSHVLWNRWRINATRMKFNFMMSVCFIRGFDAADVMREAYHTGATLFEMQHDVDGARTSGGGAMPACGGG
jgi:hypothetical protein